MNKLQLAGQRFGRLIAVRMIAKKYFSNRMWLCRCDCGTEYKVPGAKLVSGHTQSCGCYQRDKLSAAKRKRPYESAYNKLLRWAGQYEGVVISYEDFLELVKKGHCNYCGALIEWSEFNQTKGSGYYVDRKDNAKGYVRGNCVACCGTCNRMKSDMLYPDFVKHIKTLAKRLK